MTSRLSAASVAASLPLLVWFRDNVASLYRVSGTSMAPTLQDGDVVLVRRSDPGLLLEPLLANIDDDNSEDWARIRAVEHLHGVHALEAPGNLYQKPPTVLPGQIVVIQPDSLQENCIKRAIGVGGQMLEEQVTTSENSRTNHHQRRVRYLPVHHIHVEGDNASNSQDSRQHWGSINKHAVKGVASCVIWPPSRWQWLDKHQVSGAGGMRTKSRAYWS